MKTSFGFDHRSREERQAIEHLLLEEMERQQWDSITYSVILRGTHSLTTIIHEDHVENN